MSLELRGTAAAPGVATAAPWIYRPPSAGIGQGRPVADAAAEAATELEALAAALRDEGNGAEAEILDAQALMAADPELVDAAVALERDGIDPAEAILTVGAQVAESLAAIDDEVLAARAADVRDVAERIARHVTGAPAPRLPQRSIVVAEDLAPSVTVELDRSLLMGIALEGGSRTSHAAILARALGIPAVVGVPGVMHRSAGVREMAIDGGSGAVILEPDGAARERLATAIARHEADRAADDTLRTRPLSTSDGHRVTCAANVGDPEEVERAVAGGAEAVGLFRTEFAFAGPTAPTEDDQAAAYERALRAAAGAHVVFRLADIGGDKPLPYVDIGPEANPFLGVRGIRLAARHPDLFATQLRAILRASAATSTVVAIMAPMVADEADLTLFRTLVTQAQAAVPDAPAPEVGIMVEVPSAVSLADRLAAQVDFMSIGTNDLTQYLLAADRSNPALGHRQDPLHPAVLRAVRQVVEAAEPADCRVAVCGEMAGDPAGAVLLVGLGVGELSMGPEAFGPVKRAVAGHSRAALEALAADALALGSAADVRAAVAAA